MLGIEQSGGLRSKQLEKKAICLTHGVESNRLCNHHPNTDHKHDHQDPDHDPTVDRDGPEQDRKIGSTCFFGLLVGQAQHQRFGRLRER